MLELSLFGQVPASRHDQVLKIFAGIAAMPPRRTVERHMLFKPIRPVVRAVTQVGGSQGVQDAQKIARQAHANTDLYFLKLVEDLNGDGSDGEDSQNGPNDMAGKEEEVGRWTLWFHDVPEPGKRLVTARQSTFTQILQGDAVGFMTSLGYQFIEQYIVEGHEVVHNNIVLQLHRIRQLPDHISQQPNIAIGSMSEFHTFQLFDESSGFTLQAHVSVLDGSSPDVVARGTAELVNLKELLRGSIELRVIDRLALDTRVK